MHKRYAFGLTLVASLALAAACGSTTPTSETPGGDMSATAAPVATDMAPVETAAPTAIPTAAPVASATPSATPAAVPATWKDAATKDQQMAFMKTNIAPTMGKVFQENDPKKYASFSCVTCHGAKYQNPHEFLPKLTMKGGKFSGKPATIKFMMEKVVPAMAPAMGEKPFDPATKSGFGCGGCHTVEVK